MLQKLLVSLLTIRNSCCYSNGSAKTACNTITRHFLKMTHAKMRASITLNISPPTLSLSLSLSSLSLSLFMDFEKAFDLISRKPMWPILFENGIRVPWCSYYWNIYNNIKAQVRDGAKFSDYIRCTRDVKQGDICSPIFILLTRPD